MRKLKIPVLVLITIALLIVGASLPAIAAAVQDQTIVNHSGFGEMESLELDFSDPEVAPLLQKLALIRDGNFYTVSPSKTNIGQSGIEQEVKDGLAPYYEAELIPYNWKDYEFSAVPHLVYSATNEADYGIFWVVTLLVGENKDTVDMYIDDETGLILYIHYHSSSALDLYTAWGYLEAFTNAYLTSTGLAEVISVPEDFGVNEVYYSDAGLRASGDKYLLYSLLTQDYGAIELQFWLYEQGFYLMIQ